MKTGRINTNHVIIVVMVIAAFALRAAAAYPLSQLHTDEIGQYLEQAHRLGFGYGNIPWEYRVGMRSWLMPLFLAGPMKLGGVLSPDSIAYVFWPKLLVAACSLSILWAGWRLGRAVSEIHGWVAMFVAAFWYEFIFFGSHAITEPMAVAAILPAAALLLTGQPERRNLIIAGFLLGIGVILRFHYSPAVALIGILALWGHIRERILPLVIGGLLAAMLGIGIDLWFGMFPFEWVVVNFLANIVHDIASRYGVSPFYAYMHDYMRYWGYAFIPVFLCMLPAIKFHRGLFWVAVANVCIHSLIGHKEYRFVFLTTAIFILLAAIGSVEIAKWVRQRVAVRSPSWALFAVVPLWIGTSAALASTAPRNDIWNYFNTSMSLVSKAGRLPLTCGFAFEHTEFWTSGAFVTLHRDVPFFLERGLGPAARKSGVPLHAARGYNTIVALETLAPLLPEGYGKVECQPMGIEKTLPIYTPGNARMCVFQRAGPCDARGLERFQTQHIFEEFGY
jgi:GPI mannosyltransferase 3